MSNMLFLMLLYVFDTNSDLCWFPPFRQELNVNDADLYWGNYGPTHSPFCRVRWPPQVHPLLLPLPLQLKFLSLQALLPPPSISPLPSCGPHSQPRLPYTANPRPSSSRPGSFSPVPCCSSPRLSSAHPTLCLHASTLDQLVPWASVATLGVQDQALLSCRLACLPTNLRQPHHLPSICKWQGGNARIIC